MKIFLTTAQILGYPNPNTTYILETDTTIVDEVLSQIQEETECAIAHYCNALAPPEQNYCVTTKELLAVVNRVRPYFLRSATLTTDRPCFAQMAVS